MKKQQFLSELSARLKGLPQKEIDERIAFYGEMIDDRVEEGISEEEAVSEIGTVDSVASQIIAEIPLSKIMKEKMKPKRSLKGWEIALLVLGSPLWAPLLIAFFAIIFAAYVVVWSLVITVWAVELSISASALGCIFGSIPIFVNNGVFSGLAVLSLGALCVGLAILLFFAGLKITQGTFKFTKNILLGIKNTFLKKEQTV